MNQWILFLVVLCLNAKSFHGLQQSWNVLKDLPEEYMNVVRPEILNNLSSIICNIDL